MKITTKLLSLLIIFLIITSCAPDPTIGIFDANNDIGRVIHPGSVKYDKSAETYSISGSGTNMWFTNDELHYLWKKMEGDLSITADIEWLGGKSGKVLDRLFDAAQKLAGIGPKELEEMEKSLEAGQN